ncbi:MAG: FHA domain-containing protein [Nitriliruptoraceae bacterium]
MNDSASPSDANEKPVPDATIDAFDVGVFDPAHDPNVMALDDGTMAVVVVRGPNAGARYVLDEGVTTVGRHQASRIFLDDVTVSRRHAQFARNGDSVMLDDSGSLNGTYVNGERVGSAELTPGDELQIGRFKLLFVTDDTAVGDSS